MEYILAKLHIPKNGKDWYAYYSVKDPSTGELVRLKRRDGINRLKTVKEKKNKGAIMVSSLNQDLKDGWTPFQTPEEMPVFNQDFYWWFQERLNYSKSMHGHYIWKNQNNVFNKLKAFAPTLPINRLTYKFILDFEKHLIEKGNQANTIADNLVRIKVVVNEIVRSGAMEYHKNPFLNYKFKTKRVERVRLSFEDIKKLEEKELANSQDVARDMYILSFNLGGVRFGDLCRLQNDWFTKTHLKYTMHKTDKERFIKLTESAKRIVKKYKSKEKYLFDTKVNRDNEATSIDARNTFYNKRLKQACVSAGIKKISFHTARHAFADHAKKMGLDIHTIKELLGHTLVSTTEIYMKSFYKEETEAAMDKMFPK